MQGPPIRNRLLGAFTQGELQLLEPRLELVPLSASRPLFNAGEPIRHVCFPVSGFVSLVYTDRSGASTSLTVVGWEGMVGLSPLLGYGTASSRAVVAAAGLAYRLSVAEARRAFIKDGYLHPVLLGFAHLRIQQLSQAAVCNRHHSLEQQLCRWLLEAADRVPSRDLRITHEAIAMLLGVRRQGITEAALALQQRGFIRHSRGCISILDIEALGRSSCECHAIVCKQTEDFFSSLRAGAPGSRSYD